MVGNLLLAPISVLVIMYFVNQPQLGQFRANSGRNLVLGITVLFSLALVVMGCGVVPMSASSRTDVVRDIEAGGVVAVIRLTDAEQMRAVAEALLEGGVRALEVTMTVPRAVTLIEELATSLPPDVIVGAGTVLDPETARQVILAGADSSRARVQARGDRDVPSLRHRGHARVLHAHGDSGGLGSGADIVKVFRRPHSGLALQGRARPAAAGAPHAHRRRDARERGEWIRSGAVAIGVGTALVDRKAVAERRFDAITASARHFVGSGQDGAGLTAAGCR